MEIWTNLPCPRTVRTGLSGVIYGSGKWEHKNTTAVDFSVSTCLLNSMRHILFEGESESLSVMSESLRLYELYSPWNSLGQNTAVGNLSPLQGIVPT